MVEKIVTNDGRSEKVVTAESEQAQKVDAAIQPEQIEKHTSTTSAEVAAEAVADETAKTTVTAPDFPPPPLILEKAPAVQDIETAMIAAQQAEQLQTAPPVTAETTTKDTAPESDIPVAAITSYEVSDVNDEAASESPLLYSTLAEIRAAHTELSADVDEVKEPQDDYHEQYDEDGNLIVIEPAIWDTDMLIDQEESDTDTSAEPSDIIAETSVDDGEADTSQTVAELINIIQLDHDQLDEQTAAELDTALSDLKAALAELTDEPPLELEADVESIVNPDIANTTDAELPATAAEAQPLQAEVEAAIINRLTLKLEAVFIAAGIEYEPAELQQLANQLYAQRSLHQSDRQTTTAMVSSNAHQLATAFDRGTHENLIRLLGQVKQLSQQTGHTYRLLGRSAMGSLHRLFSQPTISYAYPSP